MLRLYTFYTRGKNVTIMTLRCMRALLLLLIELLTATVAAAAAAAVLLLLINTAI
jgi:hypothetical protein